MFVPIETSNNYTCNVYACHTAQRPYLIFCNVPTETWFKKKTSFLTSRWNRMKGILRYVLSWEDLIVTFAVLVSHIWLDIQRRKVVLLYCYCRIWTNSLFSVCNCSLPLSFFTIREGDRRRQTSKQLTSSQTPPSNFSGNDLRWVLLLRDRVCKIHLINLCVSNRASTPVAPQYLTGWLLGRNCWIPWATWDHSQQIHLSLNVSSTTSSYSRFAISIFILCKNQSFSYSEN